MTSLGELRRRLGLAHDTSPERYVVEGELGQGAFGRVVSARDRDLSRSVAVKVMSADTSAREDVEAFLAEAVVTGRLEHANIVPAYDVGVSDGLGLYYTMKRHSGRSLRDALDGMSLSRALDVFAQVCRAVAYAHGRGVVHSDLKPENVLLGEHGEVQVADWGLAFVVEGGAAQVGARIADGTPRYMAPEQITDLPESLDHRVDVWALGVILFELLTHTVPFDGADAEEVMEAVLTDPVVPPSRRVRSVSAALEAICLRALEKSRGARYARVEEMLADLDDELEGRRERARREALVERTLRELESALAGDDDLDVFARAADRVLEGLEAVPGHAALATGAGRLYWRVFERIYPGRPSSEGPRALALLGVLAERALSGVVAAKTGAVPSSGADDTWLALVRRLAEGEPVSASTAPPSLRALVARIELLSTVSLFASLASHQLLPIAEACEEVTLEAEETLFVTGAPGDALYVVASGSVRAEQGGAVLSTMGPGEVFGEVAVFGARLRTTSVVAAEVTTCLALDAARFAALVEANGAIGLAALRVISERLERATRREAALRAR